MIALQIPVPGPLTQGFGENPETYRRFGLAGHNGLDYGCPLGTPVKAAAAGSVVKVGNDPGGYGIYVKLAHAGGYETLYAHLASRTALLDDRIEAGEGLGRSGSTGFSTGPHLHFELRQAGKAIDPTPYFAAQAGPAAPPARPAQPDGTLTCLHLVGTVTVRSDSLRVRSKPVVEDGNIVGDLPAGHALDILGIALVDGALWLRHAKGWSAGYYPGQGWLVETVVPAHKCLFAKEV